MELADVRVRKRLRRARTSCARTEHARALIWPRGARRAVLRSTRAPRNRAGGAERLLVRAACELRVGCRCRTSRVTQPAAASNGNPFRAYGAVPAGAIHGRNTGHG